MRAWPLAVVSFNGCNQCFIHDYWPSMIIDHRNHDNLPPMIIDHRNHDYWPLKSWLLTIVIMIIVHLNHAYWPSMMDITWYRVRTGPLCFHPLTIHIRSHVTPSGLEKISLNCSVFCMEMCLAVHPDPYWGLYDMCRGGKGGLPFPLTVETRHLLQRVGCKAWRKSAENMTCLSWECVWVFGVVYEIRSVWSCW